MFSQVVGENGEMVSRLRAQPEVCSIQDLFHLQVRSQTNDLSVCDVTKALEFKSEQLS